MEDDHRWRREKRAATASSSFADAYDVDKLRTECADLRAKLRGEVEARQQLHRLRTRDKERFAEEFGQFEARLIRANETLEKNRQIVEATLVEKDKIIEQLKNEVDRKQHTIECLKQDPRLLYSSRHRQAQRPHFDHIDGSDVEDGDGKVHELERQISKLHAELQAARDMIQARDDQIDGIKAANSKLVASLKKMKTKLKEAADSGVNHMLHDMTRKCMRVEAEKVAVEDAWATTQPEVAASKASMQDMAARLATATERIAALEDDVKSRSVAQEAMEKQLVKQQHYIKDLEIDFKTIGRVDVDHPEVRDDATWSLSMEIETRDLLQMEFAQRTLAVKTEEVMELEKKVKQYERELVGLRRQAQGGGTTEPTETKRPPLSVVDLDHIHAQTLKIERKAEAVSRMVSTYEAGDPPPAVLQALLLRLDDDGGAEPCEPLASEQEGKQRILMSLMQSQAILDGVAHHLARGFARFLGSNCAMQ